MKAYFFTIIFIFSFYLGFGQFVWEHTDGPDGGESPSIFANDDYIFFSDEFFLYRSTDGLDWEKIPQNHHSIEVVSNDFLIADFYRQEPYSLTSFHGQHKISLDNGVTWTDLDTPEYIDSWAIIDDKIFARSFKKLYRITNNGTEWKELLIPDTLTCSKVFQFENYIYLFGDDHIFKGDVNGENFVDIGPKDKLGHQVLTGGFIVFGKHIYCTSNTNKQWISHDYGKTWKESDNKNGGVSTTIIDSIYYSSKVDLFRSDDFGETWSVCSTEPKGVNGIYSVVNFKNELYVTTYDYGIMKLDSSVMTLKKINGVFSGGVYDMDYYDGNLWVASGRGLFSYNIDNAEWKNVIGIGSKINSGNISISNTAMIYNNDFGKAYISRDKGLSWSELPYSGDFFVFDDVIFVIDMVTFSVKRSIDLGETWQPINFISGFNADIFKFKDNFYFKNKLGLSISNDFGKTWSIVGKDFDNQETEYHIANDRIFRFSGGVLYYSDDFSTWVNCNDGVPAIPDYTFDEFLIEIKFHDGNYYMFCENIGLFISEDDCKTWFPIGKGYRHFVLVDDYLYNGGYGGGVVRSKIPKIQGTILSGIVYRDENSNGIMDVNENGMEFQKVGIKSGNGWYPYYFNRTDEDGLFFLGVNDFMIDTIIPYIHSKYIDTIIPAYYLTNETSASKDFGISLTPDITDVSIFGFSQIFRSGYDSKMYIHYENLGTIPAQSTISMKMDEQLDFIESSPSPTEIIGDSIIWNVGDIDVFSRGKITIRVNVSKNTNANDSLSSFLYINPDKNDFSEKDNTFTLINKVYSSFDPNNKSVFPIEGLTKKEIENGNEVFYTIRFQNTGNFRAEKVKITDRIDLGLNIETLRFVESSHKVTSFGLNRGRYLEIVFDQINLIDSISNEIESHGFVTFAIQRNKKYNPNIPISNTAAIYFDFNEPIITNTVSFKIRQENSTASIDLLDKNQNSTLQIAPNPSSDYIVLSADDIQLINGDVLIYDIQGKLLLKKDGYEMNKTIDVSTLTEGLYFVQFLGKNVNRVGKFVKK